MTNSSMRKPGTDASNNVMVARILSPVPPELKRDPKMVEKYVVGQVLFLIVLLSSKFGIKFGKCGAKMF